jgi:hypothetical protein
MKSIVAESVIAKRISRYSSRPIKIGLRNSVSLLISIFSPCLLSAPNHKGSDSQNTKTKIATTEMIIDIPPKYIILLATLS